VVASVSKFNALVLNDTFVDRHHGCARVMSGLSNLLNTVDIGICCYSPAHTDWRMDPNVLAALDKADIIIVNGEGTLHHDSPQGDILLEIISVASNLKIPCALVNALWQDNGAAQIAKLSGFDLVYARDSFSNDQITGFGIACGYSPDLSFYDSYTPGRGESVGVGFTDSVLPRQTLQLEEARSAISGTIVPIQSSGSGMSAYLKFIKNHMGRSDLLQPGGLARKVTLWTRFYRARLPGPTEMLRAIEKLELLVTGRFHACTAAVITETPFLALPSNSHKIEALVSDIGLQQWRVDERIPVDGLGRAKNFAWSSVELERIRAYKSVGIDQFQKLSRELKELL